jgi:hypothetical protein
VEHQFGFSAVETIIAKQSYERMCLDNGIFVQNYLTDSRGSVEQMHIIKMGLLKDLFKPSAIWLDQ